MSNSHFTPIPNNAPGVRATWNNPMGELDEAISTHTHNPGVADDGGVIDHNYLTNIGTNSHQAIDSHVGSANNPHQTTLTQAALAGGNIGSTVVRADTNELATNDTLNVNSTLDNNLNRVRYMISQITGKVWGAAITSSIANHTHNPDVTGDGGKIVQTGIAYDASEQATPTGFISATPSILDNLGHIRYDIQQLKSGIGFADQSITSQHIKNKGLTTIDFEDRSVTEDILGWGAVTPRNLKALRPSARSDATLKSIVIDIEAGVYYLGNQVAISAGKQTYSFEAILPSVADIARIDTLYMDSVGQVLRQAGTPGSNPSPPNAPDDTLPVVQVYLRGAAPTASVGIYNTNSETGYTTADSYILRDIRPFLNLGGSGEGGGGGGDGSTWEPVISENITGANGSLTTFNTDFEFIADTTEVTVKETGSDPVVYTRVAATPGADQYLEGAGHNSITFGVAPPTGSVIRISYFKGASNPIASMVWQSTPSGTIDGSNDTFTTADEFIVGTLSVWRAESAADPLERLISGVHFTEFSSGGGFTFTSGNEPTVGQLLRVQYARSTFAIDNADTVDGYHASSTPTANYLLTLNNDAEFGVDITGTAAALRNTLVPASPFYPSITPTAGQLVALNTSANMVLPGSVTLATLKAFELTKVAADTTGENPKFTTRAVSNETVASIVAGKGGFEVRNYANATTLFSVSGSGAVSFSSDIVFPNGQGITFTKASGVGNDGRLYNLTNTIRLLLPQSGMLFQNNADTSGVVSISNTGVQIGDGGLAGTLNVMGNGSFGGTLTVTGATSVSGVATFTNNVTVVGTLTAQAASGSVAGLMSTTHYNLVNGSTTVATPSTLALRNASGHITAASFIMNTNSFTAATPYAFVGRVGSGDATLATYNPASVTVGAATTLGTGADRTKLDSINQTITTEANGWRVNYLPNGKRMWTRMYEGNPPASAEAQLTAFNLPSGTNGSTVVLNYSVGFANAQSVTFGLRWATNAGNQAAQTAFNISARDRDGTNLSTRSAWYSINLIAVEV